VARAYEELLAGYTLAPREVINGALFNTDHADLVVVRKIQYHSLCEHHLLPFHGRATVAYLPAKKLIGLSKIPRIVELFARRLQIQERLTRQVAEFLDEVLDPVGIAVAFEGSHLCARMRGVRTPGARMMTTCFLGAFETDVALRGEFLALL
jgi:GTP cyclohydrolase I